MINGLKNRLKQITLNLSKEKNPLITIYIYKSAILHNLNEFRKIKPENEVIPVLKSNAYGHGLIEIAKILEKEVKLLAVDSYFEAETLRNNGIQTPLLILGFVRPENINSSKLRNVAFAISSLEILKQIKSKVNIHLKIDTGINRQGIPFEQTAEVIDYIRQNKNIILEGLCSHFADSDGENPEFSHTQIVKWNEIVDMYGKGIKYLHLSNTFGHKFAKEIKGNSSRLGIGLYGLAHLKGMDLKPALELKSIITNIKKVKKGEKIGYNCTYTTEKDMTIGTIPVGYYEALDRRMSSACFVKVNGILCPILGRISMNITTIDLSNVSNPKIGDEVEVISKNNKDPNSIESIVKNCDTITYEMVVKIKEQLKRRVI